MPRDSGRGHYPWIRIPGTLKHIGLHQTWISLPARTPEGSPRKTCWLHGVRTVYGRIPQERLEAPRVSTGYAAQCSRSLKPRRFVSKAIIKSWAAL